VTSTIATRSHSPDTEYTVDTPSIPANRVAHCEIDFGSALIRTMAVIIGIEERCREGAPSAVGDASLMMLFFVSATPVAENG